MKKLFPAATLAATTALLFSGCVNELKVDNPYGPIGQWVYFISGDLVVKYPGKTQQELFHAVNKALDEYLGGGARVGENRPEDNPALPPFYEIFARTEGDVKVSVLISTETLGTDDTTEGTVKEWTQLSISYGAFGNLAESQKIVTAIAKHLN